MTELRSGLPELPERMRALRVDHRGYPVPWFVAWVNGTPDFRVIDGSKIPLAVKQRRCWICGEKLGVFMSFCLGPMCAINRTISEPPSHLECVRFSVQACPFLSLPKAQRREANKPEGTTEAAGLGISRNPGATLIWTTRNYQPFCVTEGGRPGVLFRVGNPEHVEWWAEGRKATRAEVLHSIETGLPQLTELASQQGEDALQALDAAVKRIQPLLPPAA